MLVNISLDAPIFGGFVWLIFVVDLGLPILPSWKLIYPTWRKEENHGLKKCLGSKGHVKPPERCDIPSNMKQKLQYVFSQTWMFQKKTCLNILKLGFRLMC